MVERGTCGRAEAPASITAPIAATSEIEASSVSPVRSW
jgi:hypothetical protein